MESVATQPINHPQNEATDLQVRYRSIRSFTETLAAPLVPEDYVVQTMEDVSPTKWHLAHVSWFFETFVLQAYASNYRAFHPQFAYLFNSYYVQAGERHCRDRRGYLSRPSVEEVYRYRRHVDEAMERLLTEADPPLSEAIEPLVEIGLNHEQQHQELLLTDIKHVFSVNPLRPTYQEEIRHLNATSLDLGWVFFDEGIYEIGHDGTGFAYDNEGPRHRVFIERFLMANRLVTCGEYLAFMQDGGYERPELWLSAGWDVRMEKDWTEPFYWEQRDGNWWAFTLHGMRPVDFREPVCHLSYFEADAYARWVGARLPSEEEWEVAAGTVPVRGRFVDEGFRHPAAADARDDELLSQMYGDVWEWTRSHYSPYPGYRPPEGALGEYNGKFMCNQFVLRGGSCATSTSHIRRTYRNFFPPDACWQFSGVRLARDV